MGFTDLTPYKLTLDFKNNQLKTLVITQYDKDARTILVTCTDNGAKKVINNTTTSAKVKWLKPDNAPVFNICHVNSDGTITINISEQMSLVEGEVTANLMLLEATTASVLHTMSFRVVVQKGVFTNDTITSTPEFQALTDTLTKVEACTTVLDGHIANVSNPHVVTKTQVGLGNADNTSDSNKPLSTASKAVIGTVYSASETYSIDDYRLYNDVLYKCNTDILIAEAWTVSHWTQVNIMGEVDASSDIKQRLGTFLSTNDAVDSTMYLTNWTKNALARTLTDLVTNNPLGTWTTVSTTVSTYLINGITYTITHASGTISSISILGTSTGAAYLYFYGSTPSYVSVSYLTNGTAYTLSGSPTGSSPTTTYGMFATSIENDALPNTIYADLGSGIQFTPSSNTKWRIGIAVQTGQTITTAKVFYPQIEVGSVKHNFVPYSGYTVTSCKKNLLINSNLSALKSANVDTWVDVDSTHSTYTHLGLVVSVYHIDGIVQSITIISGTSTAIYGFFIPMSNLPSGSYIGNGCPSNGSAKSYRSRLQYYQSGSTALQAVYDLDSGISFSGTPNLYTIIIASGYTVSTSLAYYPMLRLSTVTDATFEPSVANTTTVTNDTVSPVAMTSYNGVTNVFNQYGGLMTVNYALNEAGANLLTHMIKDATTSVRGHVKLSSATDITDSTGLALPVTEKNPTIIGTLANDISAESTKVGLLANLTTTIKTSIVNAINSLVTRLGTTDISTIGDGTVTGGISTINSSLPKTTTLTITTTSEIAPSKNSGSFTLPSYTIPSGYKIASITGACNNGSGDVGIVNISDTSFSVYLWNRNTTTSIAIGTTITLIVLFIKA